MLAVMITVLALRRVSLHESQVDTALESPAHTARFTVDVLEDLHVVDHYRHGRASEKIPVTMPLAEFLQHVSATAEGFFVVANKTGSPCGVISLDHVRSVISEQHEHLQFLLVSDAMTPLSSIAPTADLNEALEKLIASGHEYLPVIDPDDADTVLGLISQRRISAEYNAEILRRRLGEAGTKDGAS